MRIRIHDQAILIQAQSASYDLQVDLARGLWDCAWSGFGNAPLQIVSAGCAAKLMDGTNLSSTDYSGHVCQPNDISSLADQFGHGVRIAIHHRRTGSPELEQTFHLYEDLAYFLIGLSVIGEKEVATNYVAPLLIDDTEHEGAGVALGTPSKPRSLFVPYDNDAFVRYSSDYAGQSFEVTAVYDNSSRRGLVFGSVTHDRWKTGLSMSGWDHGKIGSLSVYGGAAGKDTRDTQPHGALTGPKVAGPLVFAGGFADWRDGLEAYGHANARIVPPLSWESGPPFGWNSWYAYMTKVSAANYFGASKFVKESLQPHGFQDHGMAYINLDSFWDNISESDLVNAVEAIHKSGQKAGIYWTPFVFWGNESDLSRAVDGMAEHYTYREACLKDRNGNPLPKLDGGFPMDPSHPATLSRIDWQTDQFVKWGFDYVKLDFMTHGALEGAHYDPLVTTGTSAYKLGMEKIVARLDPRRIGRTFFISLSIAPLFPAGFAHSRRISCDIYPGIGPTEYLLNSLTYGWWAGGTVYSYNDPDIMALYQVHGGKPTAEQEAHTRLNSAIVAGGVLLDGDDLSNPEAQQRALALLTNDRINSLARLGRTFRPVEGDTGTRAADAFILADQHNHNLYLAVFNYDSVNAQTKQIDLPRIGLNDRQSYQSLDLWSGRSQAVHNVLTVDLPPSGSAIYVITPT